MGTQQLKEEGKAALAAQKQVEETSDNNVKAEETEEKSLMEQSLEIEKI